MFVSVFALCVGKGEKERCRMEIIDTETVRDRLLY